MNRKHLLGGGGAPGGSVGGGVNPAKLCPAGPSVLLSGLYGSSSPQARCGGITECS